MVWTRLQHPQGVWDSAVVEGQVGWPGKENTPWLVWVPWTNAIPILRKHPLDMFGVWSTCGTRILLMLTPEKGQRTHPYAHKRHDNCILYLIKDLSTSSKAGKKSLSGTTCQAKFYWQTLDLWTHWGRHGQQLTGLELKEREQWGAPVKIYAICQFLHNDHSSNIPSKIPEAESMDHLYFTPLMQSTPRSGVPIFPCSHCRHISLIFSLLSDPLYPFQKLTWICNHYPLTLERKVNKYFLKISHLRQA